MITDNVEEAVQEILTFYRRFNSLRYVKNRLVLRMNEPLPDGTLQLGFDTGEPMSKPSCCIPT